MLVIPAIDLLGGHCVRLHQGRFDRPTDYSDEPGSVAKRWLEAGADWLHVVDLDGARTGQPVQLDAVREICQIFGNHVELGGGIRTMDALEQALALVERAIIGTAAVRDPDLVKDAVAAFGDRIAVGIDARDGMVATDGWEAASAHTAREVAERMRDLGVQTIVFTDIAVDSTLAGPNLKAIQTMAAVQGVRLIASGGIGTIAHLRQVARLGVYGCIVGKALYEGTVDLTRALHEVEDPTERYQW